MHDSEPADADAARMRTEVARLKHLLGKAQSHIERLERQADIDPLVPVYNRRAFMREAQRMQSYCQRYAAQAGLIYIDIVGFKQVNDTYGHAAGDAILLHLAAIMEEKLREFDIVGRLGGDEFGVLVRQADLAETQSIAERLAEVVAMHTVSHDGQRLSVQISTGAASLDQAADAQSALDAADKTMYAARRAPVPGA